MIEIKHTVKSFIKGFKIAVFHKELRAVMILAVITLFSGTFFYHFVEKMRLVDAFYFTSISVATVGYGDLHPKTDIGKLFTVLYVFLGIGLITGFIKQFATVVVKVHYQEFIEREKIRRARKLTALHKKTKSTID